jgi:hypothetical protein
VESNGNHVRNVTPLLAGVVACSGGNDAPGAPTAASASTSAAPTATPEASEGADSALTAREQEVADASFPAFPLTDPTVRSIDLSEIDFGGWHDEIPTLIDVGTLTQEVVGPFLVADEPAISIEINGEARIYPI